MNGFSIRIRPGLIVRIVDLSCTGAQIESQRPLRPGARVHVQLSDPERSSVLAARVVRCLVTGLSAETGPTYRAALHFDERCDWPWEAATHRGYRVPGGCAG